MTKITIKKRTIKRIVSIFLGIFLALLILEIGLRIAGFIFLAEQRHKNIITDEIEDVYRILALGESTTANLHNGQSSWPEELEIILNSRSNDIKFKVFNRGVPGTTTSKILSKLRVNLYEYKPDMVITMMGFNDKGLYIRHKNELGEKPRLLFKDFKVYKLIELITEALEFKITKIKENVQNEIKDNVEQKLKEEENRLKKAVEANSSDTRALFKLAEFYFEHKNYEEVYNVTKKMLVLKPNEYQSFYNLGVSLYKLKMYEEAEEIYKKAMEINPYDVMLYKSLGELYYDWNKPEGVIEMYKIYLTYTESIKKYDENAHIQLARAYMDVNNSKKAYEILKFVVFQNPNKKIEVFWIGELYEELNKTDEAIALFREIIEKNPNNIEAYIELAWYYLNNNRFKEAEEIFKTVMEINPRELIRAYDHIYECYQKRGHFEKADEMFKRASELRKNYSNPTTQQNHRELYEMVRKRGLKLIVMQYPTHDVDELKRMFRGDEEIIFVSNQDNFRKALESSPFEEYFVDHCCRTFGHTTKKGNQLIADNVASNILKLVES